MIDNAITSLLEQTAGVDQRVTPGSETVVIADGSILPRVTYTLINEQRRYSDDGNDGLTQAQYQVDIFAELPSQARAVGAKIQAPAEPEDAEQDPGLDGFKGTIDTTRIERIWFDGGSVRQGIKIEGRQKTIVRYLFDLLVEYRG